tara:strand:- start:25 stop:195 length:171 start_codon:yes stop_codon:yes gene_type:complete
MNFTYKKVKDHDGVKDSTTMILRKEDHAFIPFDESNVSYQIYKKWLSEGNTPEAAD